MIQIARPRPARRPGLVAMIDVVFLLIVFFMVAARLDQPQALELRVAGGGAAGEWQGPPRLVELGPEGALALNGVAVSAADLPARLRPLMPAPDAAVVLSLRDGAILADLAPLISALQAEGFANLVLTDLP